MKITSEQLQRVLKFRDALFLKLARVRAAGFALVYGIWRGYRVMEAEDNTGGLLVCCTVRGSVALRALRVVRIHWNPQNLTAEQIESGFGSLPRVSEAQERALRDEGLTRIV